MRALYLNNDNSTVNVKIIDSEKHFPGEFVESVAIISPRFHFYESWTEYYGGIDKNPQLFNLIEDGEDGLPYARHKINKLLKEFELNYVRVEFKLMEEFEKTLSGYDRVIIRPQVAYVRNIWGSGNLGLSDLYTKPTKPNF